MNRSLFTILVFVGVYLLLHPIVRAADFECPPPSEQKVFEMKGDINAKASTLLRIGNADIQGAAHKTVVDLFSKYPNADRVAIINTLLSVTCSIIKNSTQMSDADKLTRWMAVYPAVLSLMPQKSGMTEDPAIEDERAYNTLDRARKSRSYADFGQVAAVEALIAHDKPFAEMDLSGLTLTQVQFKRAQAAKVIFNASHLDDADLSDADLRHGGFVFARLVGARFDRSNLSHSDAEFVLANHASFKNCICRDADFEGADLEGADFTNADLSGANLTLSNLTNAKLTHSNLTNTFLIRSNLKGTDTDGAIVSNTDVTEATNVGMQNGVCRTTIHRPDVRVLVIERVPSSRFEGGVEHHSLFQTDVYRDKIDQDRLPICAARDNLKGGGPVYSIKGQEYVNEDINFSFSQEFLSSGDRDVTIPHRIKDQLQDLGFKGLY